MSFKILQSQAFLQNPAPILAQLRDEGALVPSKIPVMGKVWLTTTHAAAIQVLKNSENFTVRNEKGKVVGLQWWMPRLIHRLTSNMLSADEPDHKRLRGLVDQAFHRREVMSLEASIENVVEGYTRNLFAQGNEADLLPQYARPIPLAVICELLGIPPEDRSQFSKWAESIANVKGLVSFFFAINKFKPMMNYIDDLIVKTRNGEGQDGLVKELVELNQDEEALSVDELSAMIFLLLLAGHETTTHLISGGVLALLQHPDQLEKLKSDWTYLDLAVEEMLRFVSPVQSTKPRYVNRDQVIEGVEVKRGEIIMPLLVAANFDPSHIDNPEQFDIERKPNKHIEFGTGIHFCLGHQLARLEMKIAIKSLFTTYPDLRLADENSPPQYHERFGIRSMKSLMVKAN